VEAERAERTETATEQLRIMRQKLPILLHVFHKIDDPREPKTIKHKVTSLLLYGILCFVFQQGSRREANREMTSPQLIENLKEFFPEFEHIPHNDTLKRFLERINPQQLEEAQIALLRQCIRSKKFKKYLQDGTYTIAIDGTQKFISHELWDERLQQRVFGSGDDSITQYYVYVLEANLVFSNGMSLPLLSEFLDYSQGDTAAKKQDCELRAFKRLAEKLKKYFSHLPITLLMDGLYANGPAMAQCVAYHWNFMIVLQEGSLPSVWEEVEALKKLSPQNYFEQNYKERQQIFYWVNDIAYYYGPNERKKLTVHVVVCQEEWEEIEKEKRVTKKSTHAWIGNRAFNQKVLHTRCNLMARYRWGIESSFLKEKTQGYAYEHCFCQNWAGMMGYHYLMRIGHLLNELVLFTETLFKKIKARTIRGFIKYVFETCKGNWFNWNEIRTQINANYRHQLI
jgi:hypothetical protein